MAGRYVPASQYFLSCTVVNPCLVAAVTLQGDGSAQLRPVWEASRRRRGLGHASRRTAVRNVRGRQRLRGARAVVGTRVAGSAVRGRLRPSRARPAPSRPERTRVLLGVAACVLQRDQTHGAPRPTVCGADQVPRVRRRSPRQSVGRTVLLDAVPGPCPPAAQARRLDLGAASSDGWFKQRGGRR
jgi:hypothetical protein